MGIKRVGIKRVGIKRVGIKRVGINSYAVGRRRLVTAFAGTEKTIIMAPLRAVETSSRCRKQESHSNAGDTDQMPGIQTSN